jgi:MraZ protein
MQGGAGHDRRPDYCLLLYPLPTWEEIERKLTALPTLNRQVRRLQRLMIGYATELELDGHGRVRLPRSCANSRRSVGR